MLHSTLSGIVDRHRACKILLSTTRSLLKCGQTSAVSSRADGACEPQQRTYLSPARSCLSLAQNFTGHRCVPRRIYMSRSNEKTTTSTIDSVTLARQFIASLSVNERLIIKQELINAENEQKQSAETAANTATNTAVKNTAAIPIHALEITNKQLLMVGLQSGLPFIGFGFVDNFVMIVAGDMIENFFGIYLPISTMAAAGLGNAVSDVAGIGLAHHIDNFCSRILTAPKLSAEQWSRPIVGWCIVISKSICIFVGCIIGMTPLLFRDHQTSEKTSKTTKDSTS